MTDAVSPDSSARVELSDRAGLMVSLDPGQRTLAFGPEVTVSAPERRSARELSSVLYEPEAITDSDALYTAYRGVAPAEVAPEISRRGLVYVALVMRPGTLGQEWTRTRGHTNPAAQSTRVAYPEIHEVWHGRALLYLQKQAARDAEDVCVVPLSPGDKGIVPPGWASLIANVGDTPLAVGSWRTADCVPQHDALLALGGMAHFILSTPGDADGFRFAPNHHYDNAPTPRIVASRDYADFGLRHGQPMMTTFRRNPDFLRFMVRPQDYEQVWDVLYREAAET